MKAPSKRGQKSRKKVTNSSQNFSDDSDYSSEEELIREGYPLDEEPQETIETKSGWNKASKWASFPWIEELPPFDHAGMRTIKKNDFYKMNSFQVLQLMVPMSWFEEVTKETNRSDKNN